ncbi:MAG: hypothetical protein ACLS43_06595 [Evtepia gabavorous]
MIDYLRPCWEEEEWESALGLPRWPRRGRKTNFSRKTGNGRRLAPDAGQRGAAAEAWSLEERRRTGGEDVLETIEQAAQEMVSLTEQVRPRPEGWSLYAQLGQSRQIAQAAMGGREVTPFALTESLEQRTTADWGELDRAVQRDARRYDGGFFLY